MDVSNVGFSNPVMKVDNVKSAGNDTPKIKDVQNGGITGAKKDVKSVKDLKSAVDFSNKVLFKNNTHLKFQIHEKTNDIMVKIIDDETGDVVKEIPPEKILDMAAKLWEITGLFVDERR